MNENIPKINPSVIDPPEFQKINAPGEMEDVSLKPAGDPPPANSSSPKPKRKLKPFLIGFLVFLIISGVLVGVPGLIVYKKATMVLATARALESGVKAQDIVEIKKETKKLKENLLSLEGSYKLFIWTKPMPFLGAYYRDGEAAIKAGVYGMDTAEVVIETFEPYADIIGFKNGHEAKSGEESANDRIEFLVETIDDIAPKLDTVSEKLELVRREVNKINPNRYPEKIRGRLVREKMREAINLVGEVADAVRDGRPLIKKAPYLLGIEEPRTYLVLFQNDKELRPTGGFLTAYSIMKVEKGKVSPVSSNDIYNLDARYRPAVPAPDFIVKYLKGPYLLNKNLRLRDMNYLPDFKESMALFSEEAAKAGLGDIDGIVAVDTHVLVKILDVIGAIGVPGFGNFSTEVKSECDCPQVIYELESFADVEGPVVWDPLDPTRIIYAPANYDNRKKIVGPLMNSVLSNALGQPIEKLPGLFQAGWESITEKHVLFYMFDEEAQGAVETFNLAGRIKDFEGDYLHINDSNLGGRKSNLYVTQEVSQEVKVGKDGSIEKTLTISYKNPKSHDGWLNSVLPNWTRIYVPKGSELIDISGFAERQEPYEEFGKTVFAGGFELRPQGVVTITVKYKLPGQFKVKDEYRLLVQKQPGTDFSLFNLKVGREEEEFFLRADKVFRFRI